MNKISVGKLRWLYSLPLQTAYKLAGTLHAEHNSNTLSLYNGQKYSQESCNKIATDLSAKGNSLPWHFDSKAGCILYPDDGLFRWAVTTSEIDTLMLEAYKESNDPKHNPDKYFKVMPNRMNYFRGNHPISALALVLLDNAVVDFQNAIRFLKTEGYAPPERQHFDMCNDLEISWEELLVALKSAPGNGELPQGGSRPETAKRNATSSACKQIESQCLTADGKNSLSCDKFCELVKDAMTAQDQKQLYQSSAAREYFRQSEGLKAIKRKRGRPFTSKQ